MKAFIQNEFFLKNYQITLEKLIIWFNYLQCCSLIPKQTWLVPASGGTQPFPIGVAFCIWKICLKGQKNSQCPLDTIFIFKNHELWSPRERWFWYETKTPLIQPAMCCCLSHERVCQHLTFQICPCQSTYSSRRTQLWEADILHCQTPKIKQIKATLKSPSPLQWIGNKRDTTAFGRK